MSKTRNLSKILGANGLLDVAASGTVSEVSDLTASGNTVGEQAYVSGTNRLYMWNGSGWYNIALINTTPTWSSDSNPRTSYALDADSPQTATTITLVATDPEGLDLSYEYVTSGQMDSMATITQDSSNFTITPLAKADSLNGINFSGSITFRATDGVNIVPRVTSFTLNFSAASIANSSFTSMISRL